MSIQTEIERKYIIEKPSESDLAKMQGFTKSEILQIYLENTESGATHRIRKRAFAGGDVEYTENTKQRIDEMSVIECEDRISEEEFCRLSKKIDKTTTPILKTRYTFLYKGKTLEFDLYPLWKSSCIMEVELESREESFEVPDFIKVIKEVTGDTRYSNHSMTRVFPEEII